MTDQSSEEKNEGDLKDQPQAADGGVPEETPESKPDEEGEELDSSMIFKLGVVCVILWIVAGVIFFSNMGQAKIDYHLGNMAESLAKGEKIKKADIDALVELGPDAVPQLVKELNNSTETGRIGIGILVVLGRMDNDASKKALKDALSHPNHQVRNNACAQLLKVSDDATATAMVKDLWTKGDANARIQMAKFVLFRMKKELALSFVLEGCVDQVLQVRGWSVEWLRQSYPELKIPADGHTAPRKLLLPYAIKVKAWVAAGAKKDAAPKYPEFDRQEANKKPAPNPENPPKPKDTK